MKPRTKLEKEVVELSEKLPPITEKQKAWGIDKCLMKKGVLTKNKEYCLECGSNWARPKRYHKPKLIVCPCCGAVQKVLEFKKRSYKDGAYYGILTTMQGYQVYRVFMLKKACKAGLAAKVDLTEVMQHWIHPTGKVFLFAVPTAPMSYMIDSWRHDSKLELRTAYSWAAHEKLSITPYKTHPSRKIIAQLRRNGFKGGFHGASSTRFMCRLLVDPEIETLLKTKQYSMLAYALKYGGWDKGALERMGLWNSVKICIRNGYIIQDASMWVDYVQLLRMFNKDLSNSHFVCPVDLKASHDLLVKKKRDLDRRQRLEQQRKKALENEQAYVNAKGKFFGLAFTQGELTVKVLESVHEFMLEGDHLHHCVFATGYYKKNNSLILSARIGDTPVETVEVSLESLEIVQSRGLQNQPSPYHNQVIDLVKRNLPAIGQLVRQ